MKSFTYNFPEKQLVPLDLAGNLRSLGECRGKQELFSKQSPQILNTLKQVAIIQSAESSNRIEGIIVENERLKSLMEKKASPKNRPEEEVMGYRDVLNQIHNYYKRFEISPQTILKIHHDLLHYTNISGGHWKRSDNTIEERLPNGKWITRFIPVSAMETGYYMKELCSQFNYYRKEEKIDTILLILSFAFDFLCIHPFADGNGRISRLLTVLMLHQTGYDVGRYISIERLIEDSKETYYEVLHTCSNNWHQGKHNILPWWRYNVGIITAAYKEFENRAKILPLKRGSKSEWITESIHNSPVKFTISELMRSCPGVSRPMVRVILEHLRKKGKLKVSGTGRSAIWIKRANNN